MSKRISLILAVAMALLAIVIVSTFGLIPEDLRQHVLATNISFNITPTRQDDGSYSKVLEMNFKANNNTIDLYSKISILPADTTNISLKYSTDQDVSKVTVSATGILTIYDLNLHAIVVTVRTTDGTNLSDRLIIQKPSSDEAHFGDDWEWG